MSRGRVLLAGVLAAGVAAGLAATLAGATAPGANGPIAFSRYRTFVLNRPVRREIWVANPDGSGLHRLTRVKPNYVDEYPNWAPDGSRLVFTRCAPRSDAAPAWAADPCTIWTVNADGTGQRMLTPRCRAGTASPCPVDGDPAYSPDGRWVAFDRDQSTGKAVDSKLLISNTALAHTRVVFTYGRKPGVPEVGVPVWSPDGKWLAFEVCNCNGRRYKPVGVSAVYVIGVDGKGLHRVTPWKLSAGARDWSPDGSRILITSTTADNGDPGPAGGNLYTVRPDGTDLRQITHLATSDGVQIGSYSPDGTSIVFTTKAGATASTLGGEPRLWPDVFTIKTDGTGLTNITRSTNWEGTPDWAPAR